MSACASQRAFHPTAITALERPCLPFQTFDLFIALLSPSHLSPLPVIIPTTSATQRSPSSQIRPLLAAEISASSTFLDLLDRHLSLIFSHLTMWLHNVMFWTLTFIISLSLSLAQTTSCASDSLTTTDDVCTLTYVMNQPAQIPPTTTVWSVIMTTFISVRTFPCTSNLLI